MRDLPEVTRNALGVSILIPGIIISMRVSSRCLLGIYFSLKMASWLPVWQNENGHTRENPTLFLSKQKNIFNGNVHGCSQPAIADEEDDGNKILCLKMSLNPRS